MMINKVGEKLLSDLAIFSTLFSDVSLDLHKSIRVLPQKYIIYFLTGINTK